MSITPWDKVILVITEADARERRVEITDEEYKQLVEDSFQFYPHILFEGLVYRTEGSKTRGKDDKGRDYLEMTITYCYRQENALREMPAR